MPCHCLFPILFVGYLALCVGVVLGVSLKLSLPVLSAPPIFSTPALPLTVRCRSFLASFCDVLSTPPSASIFSQHAIGFLSAIVILIISFPCFSFGCFFRFCLYLLVFPLLFPCTFSSVCSFYLVVFSFLSFYFLVRFFFPVFACNKALSSQIFFPPMNISAFDPNL